MIARIALLLMALMSTASANAALWQVESINTGNVFATFTHIPGGLNPDPGHFFENITLYFSFGVVGDPFSPIPPDVNFLPNDDAHLTSVQDSNPLYVHLVMDFAAPLTNAGGVVGVDYAGIAFDGNFCRGDGLCLEWGSDSFVARTVPLPSTALLVLAAVGGLLVLRSRQQL